MAIYDKEVEASAESSTVSRSVSRFYMCEGHNVLQSGLHDNKISFQEHLVLIWNSAHNQYPVLRIGP
ncbi:hypothetical protein T01_8204 [Trichinella spiralis]|uniref:Uncharacterized protein n=1 Tax=Trichinella spiralis TaxID=6334 RepID=A0A0V1BV75_TRISP|nr:hypothetical protein T01_8204 [Trichinella spiralis]